MSHVSEIKQRPTRLPIYVDIDGTLTDLPTGKWGRVFEAKYDTSRSLGVSYS